MDERLHPDWFQRAGIRRAIGFALLAGLASLSALSLFRNSDASIARDRLTFATVERGSAQLDVTASGELVRQRRIVLKAPVDGTVQAIHVAPGGNVDEGAALLQIENVDVELAARRARLDLELEQADTAASHARLLSDIEAQKIALQRAEGDAQLARTRAASHEKLARKGIVSKIALDEYQMEARISQLAVVAERNRLDSLERQAEVFLESRELKHRMLDDVASRAEQRMADLLVAAPFGGTVERLLVVEGQAMSSGTEVAWYASNAGMDAVVRVLERSAAVVTVGSPAELRLSGTSHPAVVQSIDPRVEDGVVRVTLRPTGNLPGHALPGQRVEATIRLEGRHALWVESPADVAAYQTTTVLRRVSGRDFVEPVRVAFGSRSAGRIEVIEGLDEHDVVVVHGAPEIEAGQRLRLQ